MQTNDSNCTMQLFEDIKFDNTYKDVPDFSSVVSQDNWFTNKVVDTFSINYNKMQNSFRLGIFSLDEGIKKSYGRVKFDGSNKWWYFFVNGVSLVTNNGSVANKHVLEFEVEIDVIQTFMFDYNVRPSTVITEHVNRYIRKVQGNDYIYDADYQPNEHNPLSIHGVSAESKIVSLIRNNSTTNGNITPKDNISWCVFTFIKTTGTDKEIRIGCFPFYNNDTQFSIRTAYICSHTNIPNKIFAPTAGMIFSGMLPRVFKIPNENMLSISIVPVIGFKSYGIVDLNVKRGFISLSESSLIGYIPVVYDKSPVDYGVKIFEENVGGVGSWINDRITIESEIGYFDITQIKEAVYGGVLQQDNSISCILHMPTAKPTITSTELPMKEPKMFLAPNTKRYITDVRGNPITTYPDNIMNYVTKYNEASGLGIITLNIRTSVDSTGVTTYLFPTNDITEASILGLVTAIKADTVDIISDAWNTYKLTAKNTDRQMLFNNSVNNIIQGAVGGAVGGAVIGTRPQNGGQSGLNPITMLRGAGIMGIGGAIGGGINTYFAYQNQDLKEEGIRNQPSSLLASANNGIDCTIPGMDAYRFIETSITSIAKQQLFDLYQKYGYPVKVIEIPNTKSRTRFNFIQTNGANITGAIPTAIKEKIRNIYDNGVRFWHVENTEMYDYISPNTETYGGL